VTTRRLDVAALALAAVGAAIAAYLTWTHYADVAPLCVTGGCEIVQRSDYATLAGIPVALLGLLHYLTLGTLVLLRQWTFAVALAIVGFLFAMYLLVVQVAVIDAVCNWCVGNDVVATLLAVVLVLRVSGRGHAPAA
jgi:uncharacterized membrane protein